MAVVVVGCVVAREEPQPTSCVAASRLCRHSAQTPAPIMRLFCLVFRGRTQRRDYDDDVCLFCTLCYLMFIRFFSTRYIDDEDYDDDDDGLEFPMRARFVPMSMD